MRVSKNFIQGEKQCQVKTEVERRKRKRCPEAEERRSNVNWEKYYKGIKKVCPWSYKSFMSGKIITVPYSPDTIMNFARAFLVSKDEYGVETDCMVYVCDGKRLSWLEQQVEKLDEQFPTCEWLYSTPEDDSGHATEVPVLIQQRKQQLERLRKAIGYYETESSSGGEDAKQ